MKQKYLAKWLKLITIVVGVIGILIYFAAIPILGGDTFNVFPELDFVFWPWIILIWLTSIPFYIALVLFYMICNEIEKDNSFSEKNARLLKYVSLLAICDTVFFFTGNVVYTLLGINRLMIILLSLFVVFVGIVIGVLTASLSHLVLNASELKKENELTI